MRINEIDFREICYSICYISGGKTVEKVMADFIETNGATGILAYCYIDHMFGITFKVLSLGALNDNDEVDLRNNISDQAVNLSANQIEDSELQILSDISLYSIFEKSIIAVNDNWFTGPDVERLRKIDILDEFRNLYYPDDVFVILCKENSQPEGCWVRCEEISGDNIIGTLLNEPSAPFGVTIGDKIKFKLYDMDAGKCCISIINR